MIFFSLYNKFGILSRFLDIERRTGAFNTVSEAGRLQVLTRRDEICQLSGIHCIDWHDLHTGVDGELYSIYIVYFVSLYLFYSFILFAFCLVAFCHLLDNMNTAGVTQSASKQLKHPETFLYLD